MHARGEKFDTIDEYITLFPPGVQRMLMDLRETIRDAAPGAEETIRYGIPTFRLNGNLVHFAAYKNHIGFYPGSSAIEVFLEKLSPYKLGRGTIQFPIDRPLPLDIVREIVIYRVRENTGGGKKKR